jgi:hypothetical protein
VVIPPAAEFVLLSTFFTLETLSGAEAQHELGTHGLLQKYNE